MSPPRYLAAVTALPIAMALAGLAWVLSVRTHLPDPIATHFSGLPMRADGYSSFYTILLLPIFALGMCAIPALALTGTVRGGNARFLSASGAWASALMTCLVVGTVWPQVGAASAESLAIPNHIAWLMFLAPIIPATVAALITPPPAQSSTLTQATDSGTLNLAPGTTAVWFGQTRASKKLMAFMLLIVLVTPAVTAPLIFAAFDSLIIQMLMLAVVLAPIVIFPMFIGVKVRVDAQGVHWQSTLGIPRGSIAYTDIKAVEATTIAPGDWGGWGWRIGANGQAMLVRGGEGLHLTRTNGRNFYITVDDAKTGARLIREHLR